MQGVQGSNGFYSTCLRDKFSLVSPNSFTWRATRKRRLWITWSYSSDCVTLPTNSARILVRQLAHPLRVTDYVWPIKKMVCKWWISADCLDSSEGLVRRVHIFTRWNDRNFSIKGESERNEGSPWPFWMWCVEMRGYSKFVGMMSEGALRGWLRLS